MVIRLLASSQMARLHDSVVGQVHIIIIKPSIIEGLIQSCWAGTSGSIANPLRPAVMIRSLVVLLCGRLLQKKAHSCIAVPTLWI